jgi:hypothetical protein
MALIKLKIPEKAEELNTSASKNMPMSCTILPTNQE